MDKKETIAMLFRDTQLTMQQIADQVGVSRKVVHGVVSKRFSAAFRKARKAENYRQSRLGEKNPAFGRKGEQSAKYIGPVSDGKGYLTLLKPAWYTGRAGSPRIFLHHAVWCMMTGADCIPAGHVVHHCDNNPRNNDYPNLILMTMSEHSKWHGREGATTISKESTAKWLEAQRAVKPS